MKRFFFFIEISSMPNLHLDEKRIDILVEIN